MNRTLQPKQRINPYWLAIKTSYQLPLQAWQSSKHIFLSIILASFIINLLSLVFPLTLLQVYDRVIPNISYNTLLLLSIVVVGALIIDSILRILRTYISAWADAKFELSIGKKLLTHFFTSQISEVEKQGTGEILKRLHAMNSMHDFYAGQMLTAIVDIPFISLLLLIIGVVAGWLVLVPIVIIIIYMLSLNSKLKLLEKKVSYQQEPESRQFNFVIESLSNINTIKSCAMEQQILRRYEKLQKTVASNELQTNDYASQISIFGMNCYQAMIILVVSIGSIFVIKGMLTIGSLVACTLLAGRCLQPLTGIVKLWTRWANIKIALNNIKEQLTIPQETTELLPVLPTLQHYIKFENVSFTYSDDSKAIFNKINITIPHKKTIAIQGDGGSGKTTLFNLLLALIKPTSGKILFDDQDISLFDPKSIRHQIAYLPNHTTLFNGSILENITLFDIPNNKDNAMKIAKYIGLNEAIEALPDGYNTNVNNQRISGLSQGFAQSIGIVRALLHEPPVVIFDEANMAIDQQHDKIFKSLLEFLKGNCTLLITSHRPSIIELADEIYKIIDNELVKNDD